LIVLWTETSTNGKQIIEGNQCIESGAKKFVAKKQGDWQSCQGYNKVIKTWMYHYIELLQCLLLRYKYVSVSSWWDVSKLPTRITPAQCSKEEKRRDTIYNDSRIRT
jgi:hypothetical protein